MHWGWNVVHDGWEFRSEKERGLCTQKVSSTSLAVHSMHTVRPLRTRTRIRTRTRTRTRTQTQTRTLALTLTLTLTLTPNPQPLTPNP